MSKTKTNKLARCGGFTLIEILLAMLISSILILGVNAGYRQAHLLWSNVENRRPIYHTARLITETLREELSCLYFPPTKEEQDSPFKLSASPNGTTKLTFYTLTPSWKGSSQASRIAKVRYSFTRDPDAEETLLQRFEQPCAGEKIIGKESSEIIVKGLSDFRVWAAVANSDSPGDLWKLSYDSKNTPPKALKVSLKWAASPNLPEMGFQTIILIPCQGSLTP